MLALVEWLYQWTIVAVSWTAVVCLVVLLPMLVSRRLRVYGAVGLVYASYVFGFGCWVYSVEVAYKTLGLFWTLFGLGCFGVGVLPVALLGAIIQSRWDGVLNLIAAVALIAIPRLVGMYVIYKHSKRLEGDLPASTPGVPLELGATVDGWPAEITLRDLDHSIVIDGDDMPPGLVIEEARRFQAATERERQAGDEATARLFEARVAQYQAAFDAWAPQDPELARYLRGEPYQEATPTTPVVVTAPETWPTGLQARAREAVIHAEGADRPALVVWDMARRFRQTAQQFRELAATEEGVSQAAREAEAAFYEKQAARWQQPFEAWARQDPEVARYLQGDPD